MSCFLEILRWIVTCGGKEEEEDRNNYSRNPPAWSVASLTESHRSSSNSHPRPALPVVVINSKDFIRSNLVSTDSVKRLQNQRPTEVSPLRLSFSSQSHSPSALLPSTKASLSSPLLSKASPSPPPSKTPSASSIASPSSLPSSKAQSQKATRSASDVKSPNLSAIKQINSPLSFNCHPHSPSALPPSTKASPLLSKASSTDSPTYFPSSKAQLPSPKALPTPVRIEVIGSHKESPDLSTIKKRSMLPRYEIPENLKKQIEKDKVPMVLRNPISPASYADYFSTLLYAEDFYMEKWSKFLLTGVTLELRSREAFENAQEITKLVGRDKQRGKDKPETKEKSKKRENDFVAFVIDSVPEERPFLLSRDFVFVRPSGEREEPFKGILYRVVKSTLILVEFEDDFHAQHSSTKTYDVSFSFNRVCLKRSHEAIFAGVDPSRHNILFPALTSDLYSSFCINDSNGYMKLAISRIMNHKGPLPYLIEEPNSTFARYQPDTDNDRYHHRPSSIGHLIQEATLQIYRSTPHCRILICAPRNLTCDTLMQGLGPEIPKSMLFRANAAFREYFEVPEDIIEACVYKDECFTCPPLAELKNFKVITSTFMSSFRLHAAGIDTDHFTHIFVVDASSVTEPEVIVPLVNFVGKRTIVVVTGSSRDFPRWVRSVIGRRHGLRRSYFHRLLDGTPYTTKDPKFITCLI